ncbi:hypothetical protein [Propionimicrobium sp. PCR01-08-3]|uniref:hypothetical protein n=1 Tax=Propionimicrobium sp. PCR01-08-3 TaxID=3052086 RepID=UPI00255CE34F|nr:hypothetical protein [Propionimicrobium sp. PCR01-08-3]WIY82141.1 hypothetical protein QQ658_11600 [Propionimicrobium sp. PCR01-08-3]
MGYELAQAARDAVESILDPTMHWSYYRAKKTEPQIYSRRVSGFPFHVIYFFHEAEIMVVVCAHERRRPGYWEYRLND